MARLTLLVDSLVALVLVSAMIVLAMQMMQGELNPTSVAFASVQGALAYYVLQVRNMLNGRDGGCGGA